MKHFSKIFIGLLCIAAIFTACDKAEDLPVYTQGEAPLLTASKTTVAPAPSDSLSTVISFAWTSPKFSTDTASYKYVLQIDTVGSFTNPATKTVSSDLTVSLAGKEMNSILLGYGFAFNVPHDVYARLIASYGNNNEQMVSNTIKLSATAYKIPPKIAVPNLLYIVGDLNGYNNSSSLDTKYQFSKIDETTYAGVFNFPGGGAYKLIQTLGNWSTQFHMISGGSATSGQFEQKDSDPGFVAPATAGWYRVTLDFQHGTYTTTPAPPRVATPANLYIVGDLNGYNNSSSLDPKYKFTLSSDPFVYTLTVDFPGGGAYKLIQTLGNWSTQFHMISGGNSSAGQFEQADADPGFPAPTAAGKYKVTVNFAANYFFVTKT